jgi:hypothetical protein
MTGLSRRRVMALALAACAAPAAAADTGWIEVVGMAHPRNAADMDAARRRALADALCSAALAAGAEVRAHTAVQDARVTADLLLVRPVGRIIEHRVLSAAFDGRAWLVRIRARVGPPGQGTCARRRLVLAAGAPRLSVPPGVVGWAAALLPLLAADLVAAAERAPAVVALTRLPPPRDPGRDRIGTNYRTATRPAVAMPSGAHLLTLDLSLEPLGRELRLSVEMTLAAPAGEALRSRHAAAVTLPGASPLGRSAVLLHPGRAGMTRKLLLGARPALLRLLDTAACRPVTARLRVSDGTIRVDVGRRHGLLPSALAFTADATGPAGVLEIVALGDDHAHLRPMDMQAAVRGFAGRVVRFVDLGPSW